MDAVLDQKPFLALEMLAFPAVSVQFRSRSIEIFGQFNGRKCADAVGDRRQCVPTEACEDPEDECGNDFQCGTGNPPLPSVCLYKPKEGNVLPDPHTSKCGYKKNPNIMCGHSSLTLTYV